MLTRRGGKVARGRSTPEQVVATVTAIYAAVVHLKAITARSPLVTDHLSKLSQRYMRFAREEAAGRSPYYADLARGVATDEYVLTFLYSLPKEKQQPNLLFAAFRHLFGLKSGYEQFRDTLSENLAAVRTLMEGRSTQTNEPARCAALLPVLCLLPQPLALIEVGASAGLCLLVDRYGYDYGQSVLHPKLEHDSYPVFQCTVSDRTPIPTTLPEIAWRAGLDLQPLDAADPAEAAWLETLVWPEQEIRLSNLRAALELAARTKPHLVKGDLAGRELDALCAQAPSDATLVVFHTAVLAYVEEPAARRAFAAKVSSLCDYWICNEAPGIFPEIAERASAVQPPGSFLLSVNGHPVAWTDPHGASVDWIADDQEFLKRPGRTA